jgi:hypothetical protein
MTNTQEVANEMEQDEAQKVIKSTEGPLKQMLVEYVGSVLRPDDGQVTVEMIVQTLASEFPEFLLVVARENWIRGYEQALNDVENVEKERAAEIQSTASKEKKVGSKTKAKKKKKNDE